jgi:NitT/TauT family transport system substrate-binding protein
MSRLWIAFFFLLLSTNAVRAQPLTRVMSGYAATSGPHAVLWLARDAGLFEKNGLRTEVAYIRSGSTMGQALVAGEIQLAQMGGPAALAAGVAGFDVTMVAVALNTTPIVIMGKVSKMEELKGKAIGVTRYGSNTDISARFAIRKVGMQPEKDVALVQLEDSAGIMGGIQSGRIAAGALADPFTDHAKKLGYKEIADIAALGLEFPFVGIVTKKTFIKEKPDLVQRFVRAYTESIALYKNNRELAKKVTSKYTGINDPEILNSTVDF